MHERCGGGGRGSLPALWQGTAWRAGHFTFRAAPCGDAETDADKQCSSAAETTPGPRVVRENKCGNQSQIQPYPAVQTPQDAPARSAGSGQHSGHGKNGRVFGVVRPPIRLSSLVRLIDLAGKGDGCGDK